MDTTSSPIKRAVDLLGSQVALAKILGVRQPTIWKWLNGTRFPAEYCIPVEAATGGRVTRYELRPDIYPPDEQPKTAA